jgi:hypothetical protein
MGCAVRLSAPPRAWDPVPDHLRTNNLECLRGAGIGRRTQGTLEAAILADAKLNWSRYGVSGFTLC